MGCLEFHGVFGRDKQVYFFWYLFFILPENYKIRVLEISVSQSGLKLYLCQNKNLFDSFLLRNNAEKSHLLNQVICLGNTENTTFRRIFFAAAMLFLLIFSSIIYPANTLKCHAEPFLVPYEWYQPGDILIGGMTSQIIYIFNQLLFEEHPSQNLFSIPK